MSILSYVLADDPRVAAAVRKPEYLQMKCPLVVRSPVTEKTTISWSPGRYQPGCRTQGVPQSVGLFREAL